jgi:hypothetical protein
MPFCFFLDSLRSDDSRSRIAGFLIANQIHFPSAFSAFLARKSDARKSSSIIMRNKIGLKYSRVLSVKCLFNTFHVYEMILDSYIRIFYATDINVSCYVIVVTQIILKSDPLSYYLNIGHYPNFRKPSLRSHTFQTQTSRIEVRAANLCQTLRFCGKITFLLMY